MFSCILFDLDGTISDPKQGICGCVQYALRSFGIEEPELDRLEPFIGPPLAESFMKYYNFTAEQAQEAVEKYRERFSVTGKYENVLYPGMGALLHDLKASGRRWRLHLANRPFMWRIFWCISESGNILTSWSEASWTEEECTKKRWLQRCCPSLQRGAKAIRIRW